MFKYYSLKVFGFKVREGKKIPKYHITPHMLRHTHVTELAREYISKGEQINWEYISKRIGHSSITTTIEKYAHLKSEDYKLEYQRIQEYKKQKRKA